MNVTDPNGLESTPVTVTHLPFSHSSSRVAHVKLQQWAEDELSSSRNSNNQFSSSLSSSAAWGSGGGSCGDECEQKKKRLILRKATVAYGIATLLEQAAAAHRHSVDSLDRTPSSVVSINKQLCNIDNFIVRINTTAQSSSSHPCSDIEGVDVLSPRLSVNIIEPSFLQDWDHDVRCYVKLGRCVEAEFCQSVFIPDKATVVDASAVDEDEYCIMFGVLMRELFYHSSDVVNRRGESGGSTAPMPLSPSAWGSLPPDGSFHSCASTRSSFLSGSFHSCASKSHGEAIFTKGGDGTFLTDGSIHNHIHNNILGRDDESGQLAGRKSDASLEPSRKKTQRVDLRANDDVEALNTAANYMNLSDMRQDRFGARNASVEEGLPSSLCLLIQNLTDCGGDGSRPGNAYDSLESVIKDLHLLLLDPERFLFDNEPTHRDTNGRIMPSFREHTLYGRDNEVFTITEAFCRVSGGDCESLFIGGFSGSGKSRLVNDLTERVGAVGGYVLSHKFDQIMSKGRSMLEIIALFNELCLLISEKNAEHDILALVDDLIGIFGPDLSSLARLLPNIKVLASELKLPMSEKESASQPNLRSICYTLQQFIGVVSSAVHPVVLFLDDMQWCDNSVFTVVESIFGVANRLNCLFFVGAFRSNEVANDHEIFRSADRLKSSGVPTAMMSLEGLQPNDLNTMISDALGVFPRISGPLSDIVFEKTKGNPYFVVAFLRSLVDRGLLKFCVNTRRWIWDKDDVSSMDVTGNVLHLLSFKMTGLSTSIQTALKTAACFGIKIDQAVVTFLAATNPEHADIHGKLEQVVKEGFMVKIGTSNFRFAHDKVREAAYSLIPNEEKNQVSKAW